MPRAKGKAKDRKKAAAAILRPEDWKPIFLTKLRQCGNIRAACEEVGISRVAAYIQKRDDKEFADAWNEAMDDAIDLLEKVAWKRANKTSDTLLIFLLKSRRRDVYGDQHRHTHTGDSKNPIQHNHQGKVELIGRIEQYTAAFAQLGEGGSEAEGDPGGDDLREPLDTGPVQVTALDEASPIPGP